MGCFADIIRLVMGIGGFGLCLYLLTTNDYHLTFWEVMERPVPTGSFLSFIVSIVGWISFCAGGKRKSDG